MANSGQLLVAIHHSAVKDPKSLTNDQAVEPTDVQRETGDEGNAQCERVPMPFTRLLRYDIAGFFGIKKSKFYFGGLGLPVFTGFVTIVQIEQMLPGHTKFYPGQIALQ